MLEIRCRARNLGLQTDFKPVFSRARDAGVPIVLHSGENKASQREWQQMMEFK